MFLKTHHKYSFVSHDDEETIHQSLSRKVSWVDRFSPKILLLIMVAISSITATSVIYFYRRPSQPLWTSCGNTTENARARGCLFDLISFAWQTPECYDSSLVSEFVSWDDWSFSEEEYGNQTIPLEVALRGEQSLWVTWHYHMVHCTFMWRQMHRAYENGWIDAHLHAYNHTLHCQKKILQLPRFEPELVNTQALVIYPTCERIGKSSKSGWWDSVYSV